MGFERTNGQPVQTCGDPRFGSLIKHVHAAAVKSGEEAAAINGEGVYIVSEPYTVALRKPYVKILPSAPRFVYAKNGSFDQYGVPAIYTLLLSTAQAVGQAI